MQRKRRSRQHKNEQAKSQWTYTLKSFTDKYMLISFIVLFACVGVFNAFRFGAASLDYYAVKNSINLWINDGAVQSKDSFLDAKSAIATANLLHHSNPLYIELDAQIKEWGVLSGFEPNMTLDQAKESYIAGLELRPLWPVTWANLAMLKWRNQEFDNELLDYLNKATILGGQKLEVRLLFTQLGLTLYKANHPFYTQIKVEVHKHIENAIRGNATRRRFTSIIVQGGHLKTVCRWFSKKDDLIAYSLLECKKEGY